MEKLQTDISYSNTIFAWLQSPDDVVPALESWHQAQLLEDYGTGSMQDLLPDGRIDESLLLAIRLKLSGFGAAVLSKLSRDDTLAQLFNEADAYFKALDFHGGTDDDSGGDAEYTPVPKGFQLSISREAIYNAGSSTLFNGTEKEEHWQERALCAQTDPESFFPEKGGSTREAKRVCQSCEVREECLKSALDNDERFGIWGGFSERERRKLKRNGTGALEAIESKKMGDSQAEDRYEVEAGRDYREEDRLYSPKVDHAGRIRQLAIFCELNELQTEIIEYDDDVRNAFISDIVSKVFHVEHAVSGNVASQDIGRLTNYFIVDDIVKIWSLFDQDHDYWEDMTHLLKNFHSTIKAIHAKQGEYEADFAQTVELCMENAQFDLSNRTA